jgi:hypothetical protein
MGCCIGTGFAAGGLFTYRAFLGTTGFFSVIVSGFTFG